MAESSHAHWLQRFFVPPNGVDWPSISAGTEPAAIAEVLRPWLKLLEDESSSAPIILPFVRNANISGWYATAREAGRTEELYYLLNAWFGWTWLSRFDRTTPAMTDPMAAALRDAFGTTVFRFAGSDAAANRRISTDLGSLATLLTRRPARLKIERRPVGTIRTEFDRALLIRDEASAKALAEELRHSGRLNDENLRYLDVRLRAGLALWPQIAHDHWLLKTLSELLLPPQIIADLIEALYRTFLDPIEATASGDDLLAAFNEHIADRYPRLFASRRGVRTARVVKAFLLFERRQPTPNVQILNELAALLSDADRGKEPFASLAMLAEPAVLVPTDLEAADESFEDGNFDRAFELYLAPPASKRSLSRLIFCATLIGTRDVIEKLVAKVEQAASSFDELAPTIRAKFDELLAERFPNVGPVVPDENGALPVAPSDWVEWAERLRHGNAVPLASDAAVTWDAGVISNSLGEAKAFADAVGNASGAAAESVRHAVPLIYGAFLGDQMDAGTATKPIANTLFMLIAMEDGLSQVDLGLLLQLLGQLLASGMTNSEYISLVDALSDVQERVGSYAHLAWSLDVAETLAVVPAPSREAHSVRQQFFLLVLTKTHAFEHRLRADERHAFRILARDYGVDLDALGQVGRREAEADAEALPDLWGKTIGVYTLTEAAGARAKNALETMFPGVTVTLNADLVATAKLASLAKNANYFVFAWRSSSHSAYYCIKHAMGEREPIIAMGKGTASILRAVIDTVR